MKMAKRGNTLNILTLIFSISGLGLGLFAYSNSINTNLQFEQLQDDQRIWHSSYLNIFSPTPLVYEVIPNISILFDLSDPISLHLLFTCKVHLNPDPVGFSTILFYFMINQVRLDHPFTRVGSNHENVTSDEYYSVAFQHFIEETSEDSYNITVQIISEYGGYVRDCVFTIQSYPI